MENATDAIKIAFAVLIFVMALSISIMMFSQLNQVSAIVLTNNDITNFYNYTISNESTRVVGLETIIPTLYKYYKENYTVLFLEKNTDVVKPLGLYTSQTNRELWGSGIDSETGLNPNAGNIAKYYTTNPSNYRDWRNTWDQKKVCTFDVDEETIRHEPWTGSNLDFKKNLDAFLYGGTFDYPSGNGQKYNYADSNHLNHSKGFVGKYGTTKFKEMLGEYTYTVEDNDNNSLLKNRKKRIIIYQEIN